MLYFLSRDAFFHLRIHGRYLFASIWSEKPKRFMIHMTTLWYWTQISGLGNPHASLSGAPDAGVFPHGPFYWNESLVSV